MKLNIYPKNKFLKFILKNFVYPIIMTLGIFYMLAYLILLKTDKIAEIKNISVYVSENYSFNKDSVVKYVEYGTDYLTQKNLDCDYNIKIVFCETWLEYKLRCLFIGTQSYANTKACLRRIIVSPISVPQDSMSETSSDSIYIVGRCVDETIAHEFTHVYQHSYLGFLKVCCKQITEPWKMEGYADYVANESVYNVNVGQKMFMEGRYSDEENWIEEAPFVNYFVGRLRTDYLLEYKKMPVEEYWNTKFDTEQLDEEIRSAFREGKYKLFKQNSHS